jgi:hypothetical protein
VDESIHVAHGCWQRPGVQHNGQCGLQSLDLTRKLGASSSAQHVVCQDQAHGSFAAHVQGFGCGAGVKNREAVPLKNPPQSDRLGFIVLNVQNKRRAELLRLGFGQLGQMTH